MHTTLKRYIMIQLIISVFLILIITIYSKVKEKKSNSFPKDYLLTINSKPKSTNY